MRDTHGIFMQKSASWIIQYVWARLFWVKLKVVMQWPFRNSRFLNQNFCEEETPCRSHNNHWERLSLIQLCLNLNVFSTCSLHLTDPVSSSQLCNYSLIQKVSSQSPELGFSFQLRDRLWVEELACTWDERNLSRVQWSSYTILLFLLVFQWSLKWKKTLTTWKNSVRGWRGKKETIESWKPHFDAVWLRLYCSHAHTKFPRHANQRT